MNTKELVKSAGARFKHAESKLRLHEKYVARLIIAHGGGMWRITPELIAFLGMNQGAIVLLDIYETPTKIDSQQLLHVAQEIYTRVMNEWLAEYTELSKNR